MFNVQCVDLERTLDVSKAFRTHDTIASLVEGKFEDIYQKRTLPLRERASSTATLAFTSWRGFPVPT
jgi:hypothetical protein